MSQINGCAYCIDLHSRDLLKAGPHVEHLVLVATWHEAANITQGARQLTGDCSRLRRARAQLQLSQLRCLSLANGQLPARSNEMAGVAAGIAQEIILVLGLGFPEVAYRHDFGYDFAGPQLGFVDVSDRVLGDTTLLVARVEDRRSIARPEVVSLPIARGRIVNLEEELEDLPIADPGRIKDDLDRFCVCPMIAIGSMQAIRCGATGMSL